MSRIKKLLSSMQQISQAADFYQTSFWFQASRVRRLHDKSLFSLEDTLFWGLTDPAIPTAEIDSFMSREARTRLQARVNDPARGPDVDDKAVFYSLCTSCGLPVPETFGILETAGKPRTAHTLPPQAVRISFSALPDGDFVAKPIWGMKGKGLLFFRKAGGQYLLDGSTLDEAAISKVADSYAAKDYLIVQRRLLPHAALADTSDTDAVQSVRIVTYLDGDGMAHILFARFKFIRQGNNVDNFADGQTGNLIADVDLDSGRIKKTLRKVVGEFGLQVLSLHPDTGKSLDITLPDWSDAVQLAIAGAKQFNSLRTLAWDIALTPDGPVILEANQDWEIFPIAPYRKPSPPGDWESLIR
ncbi:MAG: hypothetical protein KDI34_11765 [Halioglobus sp.]|nr:hypothetical protein [Halioglobus sp.]